MSEAVAEKRYPKPEGREVDFYLAANPQYKKGERIPVSINGYDYIAVVGQRNKLPQEVVEVLKNAKSKTEKVDTKRYDPDKGGVPRSQEAFFQPEKDYVYQSEFDIEELN